MDLVTYALSKKGMNNAVSDYLDEHLTNPTNPPIDTSLTIAGAAADSKETGDKITQLKEDLNGKANNFIYDDRNLLVGKTYHPGYRTNTGIYENNTLMWTTINVEVGTTYVAQSVRFVYSDSKQIVNGTSYSTLYRFTPSSTILYVSCSKNKDVLSFAMICKESDYDTTFGGVSNPQFKPHSIEQTVGVREGGLMSQLAIYKHIVSRLPKIEDGTDLFPFSIKVNNYYAFKNTDDNTSNKVITWSNDPNYNTHIIYTGGGRFHSNKPARFLIAVDEYGIVVHYTQHRTVHKIPDNAVCVYISVLVSDENDFSFIKGYTITPGEAKFTIGQHDELTTDANVLNTATYTPNASRSSGTWYTTDAYANNSVYAFNAKANVTYKFGCATRFFDVDDTSVISSGTNAGYTYTPENDCVISVSIPNSVDPNNLKVVALPTTLDEVNPYGIPTVRKDILVNESGNNPNLIMSQRAVTELVNSSTSVNIGEKVYGAGSQSATGDLSDGDSLSLPKTNVKKNNTLAFVGKVSSFGSLLVGKGKNSYGGSWLEITDTNVIVHNYTSADSTRTYTHNLAIADYIYLNILVGVSSAKISIYSNGQRYEEQNVPWDGSGNNPPFVESVGSTISECKFTWASGDFRKATWMFGDSYFGMTSSSRWVYYLMQDGFGDNVLLNAYAGENTTVAISSLDNMISHYGKPNTIVWCLGMNDGSDSNSTTPSSVWLNGYNHVKSLCETYGITLILATIPSVPGRTGVSPICHEGKNALVRESGYRYIDFEKAVGAEWNGENTTWYTGMLSSDGVHPDVKGALALYHRALTDCPEITYANP